jgi:hypothetical protein
VGSIAAYQVNKSLPGPVSGKELPRSKSTKLLPTIGFGISLAVPDVIKGVKKAQKPCLNYSFYDKDTLLTKSYLKKVLRKGSPSLLSVAPNDGFLKINLIGDNKNDVTFNSLVVDSKKNTNIVYAGNIAFTLGADYTGGCIPTYQGPLIDNYTPTTMTPQSGNECVPAILGYLEGFCGGNQTSNDFINLYHDMFNNNDDIATTGMSFTSSSLNYFLASTFTTESMVDAGGVTGALNHGLPVFAVIPSVDPNMAHAVAIVGYNIAANGSVTYGYMDPDTGVLESIDANIFSQTAITQIVITGSATWLQPPKI